MLEETNLFVISHIGHFIRRSKRVHFNIEVKKLLSEYATSNVLAHKFLNALKVIDMKVRRVRRTRIFQEICPTHQPVTRLHRYPVKPNAHGSKL
ncbi:hypothetical protein PRUPE_8G181500 [Prunus persica]|uniref:Uncharacterized protein n=1 Tax=Prunus persica TaxID=3760 RepID=A0A251MZQ4_PRUPE|nr:hypothetical protein PRUPE_8G181500 [Prunus persica]